jgi:hypothetical protein
LHIQNRHLVMEIFYSAASTQTPMISMNASTGNIEIKGRAIPDDAEPFWGPVLSWFDAYASEANNETSVVIDLEYFNISSSKRILFLLYKLNEIVAKGKSAKVVWCYKESDEDMYEVGQDYAFMVKVPFEFKAYNDSDLQTA